MIIRKSCFEYEGKKICGYFYIPGHDGKFPAVVMVHGFGGGVHEKKNVLLCEELARAGIAVYMFDFYDKPNSLSEILVEDMTVTLQLQVLRHAVDYVMAQDFVDMRRVAITGHSLGGMTVLLYGAVDDRLKGVVAQAAVSEFEKNSEPEFQNLEEWERDGVRLFGSDYGNVAVKWSFIEDGRNHDVYEACHKIKAPVLVLHGDKDECIPLEQAQEQIKHLKSTDKLVVIRDADHCFYPASCLYEATKLLVDFMMGVLGVKAPKQVVSIGEDDPEAMGEEE